MIILSVTILYRLRYYPAGRGGGALLGGKRFSSKALFEYDPFAKDVDSYGVEVEDEESGAIEWRRALVAGIVR